MKQRIISAVIALIICIPIILIGGITFKIGVGILSIIGLYELFKCSSKNIKYPLFIKLLSYILIFLFVILNEKIIIKIFILFLLLGIPIIFIDKEKYNIESFMYSFSSIVFLGIIFSYLIKIRLDDINIFIFLFLVTILTDTFAYIIGKSIGKHKFKWQAKISPNKTVEGTIFGILIGTIIPTIYYIYMIDPGSSFIVTSIMVLLLSILGQLGDLFFSSIKRFYNIKDFSNLMPGHGGVLDRLDSIIFVLMGYVVLINFI